MIAQWDTLLHCRYLKTSSTFCHSFQIFNSIAIHRNVCCKFCAFWCCTWRVAKFDFSPHAVHLLYCLCKHKLCTILQSVLIYKMNHILCHYYLYINHELWIVPLHHQHMYLFLIFVVPCIMLYSGEISPTRCNNCVFYSQWFFSTCFGWQSHPSSGVQCCIWPQVSWFT